MILLGNSMGFMENTMKPCNIVGKKENPYHNYLYFTEIKVIQRVPVVIEGILFAVQSFS